MIFIHIKIVLYFIYILHAILKKSLSNFSFLNFCSLIKNENIKRLGFYTLQVTSNKGFLVFSTAKTTK